MNAVSEVKYSTIIEEKFLDGLSGEYILQIGKSQPFNGTISGKILSVDTVKIGTIKMLSGNLIHLRLEKDSSLVEMGSMDGRNFTGKREKSGEKFRLIKK